MFHSQTKPLILSHTKVSPQIEMLFKVFGASLFLVLATKIIIPCYPVPMSMQSFAVLMIGFTLPPMAAMSAVVLYLIYGATGLPVFTTGGGLQFFVSPTGGFLLGFILMAGGISLAKQKLHPTTFLHYFGIALMGNFFLYAPGITHLAQIFGWDKAIAFGLLPFLCALPVKSALAACLLGLKRQ